MRILHLIATLDRRAGGPSNSIRRILAAYPASGGEGEVVTLDDPAAPFLNDISCKVHALGPVSTKFGYTARLIPWLRANRDRYDGFVVHGLWQYLGVAARRAIYAHKPYLVFTHGMLDPWFMRAYPLKHLKKIPYWLLNEYWVLRHANRVLFTSTSEAQLATRSFWPNRWVAQVIPYGASGPQGDPATLIDIFLAAHPALRQLDGSPRRFLLFLGRIHSKKGCHLLLEAFARIATRWPDLHLVFAGPVSANARYQDKLKARATALGISDRVHWPGMLEDDQKWGAFHACEAFCLPSHQENFGIAVAEALACARPVLISDKVNIWQEVATDGAALTGPDTADGTLQVLEQWIALDTAQKASMSSRALNCFRRRYDLQATASSILEIVTRAAQADVPRPAPLSKKNIAAL